MKNTFQTFLCAGVVVVAMLSGSALYGQYRPYVDTVSNSASYMQADTDGYGVAQGSIAVLFGNELGPEQLVQSSGFPLPLTLGGVSITVAVNGASQDVPVVYASSAQTAFLLPSTVPVGTGTITVKYRGTAGVATAIKVVESAFGIYSVNSSGMGNGVITSADYKLKSLTAAGRPGESLILWGTGLGPVAGVEAAGPLPGNRFLSAEVYVGNQRAKVTYAGRSGCCAGLDQIVFDIPEGALGCSVPVSVRTGSVTSNFVILPVSSDGGPCSEPVGLTGDQLRVAQAGKPIQLAAIGLGPLPVLHTSGLYSTAQVAGRLSKAMGTRVSHSQMQALMQGSGDARRKAVLELLSAGAPRRTTRIARLRGLRQVTREFEQQASAATFGQVGFLTRVVNQFGAVFPSPGGCAVFPDNAMDRGTWLVQKKAMDAGAELVLNGPLGTRSLRRIGTGRYETSFGGGFTTQQLPAGRYSVTATGGADVGAFTATLQVAAPPRWTNKPAAGASVSRSTPLDVTWSGVTDGYLVFGGSARAEVQRTYTCPGCGPNGRDTTGTYDHTVGSHFICVEEARKGRLTVPAHVLQALPVGKSSEASFFLGIHPFQNRFIAPGLDSAFIADLNTDNRDAVLR
jgi:uncharacterized protein (TIGR03437 family)